MSDSLSTASASYETSDTLGISIQASGSTAGNNVLGVYGGYISSSGDVLNFTLSPNSQLQIFADSNVFLETTSDGFPNYGFSGTVLKASKFRGPFSNSGFAIDEASSEFTASLNEPQTLSELTTLSILIGNTLSEDLYGRVIYGAGNYGYADYDYPELPSSEVPVPAALPLMASALGLFGLLRRKNKVASI